MGENKSRIFNDTAAQFTRRLKSRRGSDNDKDHRQANTFPSRNSFIETYVLHKSNHSLSSVNKYMYGLTLISVKPIDPSRCSRRIYGPALIVRKNTYVGRSDLN